jgi:hypothetical protein
VASLSKLKSVGAHGLENLQEFVEERIDVIISKLENSVDGTEMLRIQGELRSLRWIVSSIEEAKK